MSKIHFNEAQNQGAIYKYYRKKPVTIAAVLFTGENGEAVASWCKGNLVTSDKGYQSFVEINTLEGTMLAMPGDYVIQGVEGEFYPCKPDIFNKTYEAV